MVNLFRSAACLMFVVLLIPIDSLAAGHKSRIAQAKCSAQHHTKCTLKRAERRVTSVRSIWSGPLDGTAAERRQKLAMENRIADRHGLPRFQNLSDIRGSHRDLIPVPDNAEGFYVDQHVVADRRYVQPWTYHYLTTLSAAFMSETASAMTYPKLKLTSLVRDQEYQVRLRSVAKCQDPESCSTHLTGATFDVSFRNMSKEQFRWLYSRLSEDVRLGKVNAIHEPLSGCFHVFVIPPKTVLALE